ncbi:hypothetical protein AKJ09_01463 [Labilithrix luteola]|uniref:N-acetyltransferase domain-containing protein n=1 Tax=Labilithrix luteola TaxID=1391654 RepID=A0A0K1PNV9_9BACT|nr:hypothetical protein AKJ09_01463 [Labilithrix luteola]
MLDLVRRHGWNATAFQTLGGEYSYFFHGEGEARGCVAYVDTGRAWVAAGAPIVAEESIAELATEFVRAARAAGKRCCFFAVEDRLPDATGEALRSIRIGEQPVWDPREWPEILREHKSLREQLRRARAKGVRVREVSPEELAHGPTGEAIRTVAERWLAAHEMAPMGFLVDVEPLSRAPHRACFVAEREGTVIGFAGVIPVPARGGWFVENLLRVPDAPNGTAELLVDTVMRWAANVKCQWLTLGLAPLAGDVPGALRFARRFSAPLYDFEGLRRYKAKLQPRVWSAIHLSYPSEQSAGASLFDALEAFTRGGFVRFGLATLLRGPTFVLRLLALALVPWTILLAIAPARLWFGTPAVKWFWVAFDIVVALGLFRLLRTRDVALMTVLAVAVTSDALLTLVEAIVWNVRHMQGVGDALVVLAACAAPALASVVLWGARGRILRMRGV